MRVRYGSAHKAQPLKKAESSPYLLAMVFKNTKPWDSPGGPSVKNPPCNTGDVGSVCGQGTKILHTAEPVEGN